MGLAPSTGGDGSYGCSADMILQALLGCTGTTLRAVATSLGLVFDECIVTAEGDYDARGTLGVDKAVPVGLTKVRLNFEFRVQDATSEGYVYGSKEWERLLDMTERYCVVAQTLKPGLKEGIELHYTVNHSSE